MKSIEFYFNDEKTNSLLLLYLFGHVLYFSEGIEGSQDYYACRSITSIKDTLDFEIFFWMRSNQSEFSHLRVVFEDSESGITDSFMYSLNSMTKTKNTENEISLADDISTDVLIEDILITIEEELIKWSDGEIFKDDVKCLTVNWFDDEGYESHSVILPWPNTEEYRATIDADYIYYIHHSNTEISALFCCKESDVVEWLTENISGESFDEMLCPLSVIIGITSDTNNNHFWNKTRNFQEVVCLHNYEVINPDMVEEIDDNYFDNLKDESMRWLETNLTSTFQKYKKHHI